MQSEGLEIVGSLSEPDRAGLYEDNASRLARVAYLMTGDAVAARDIVQDAFVSLEHHHDHVASPVAYLRQSVINLSRSWVKRQGLERRAFSRLMIDESRPDCADVLAVQAAMRRLSSRQLAAVVLRYYEDLPEAEIARALGCRPGTVKSLLSRGLAVMQEELTDD